MRLIPFFLLGVSFSILHAQPEDCPLSIEGRALLPVIVSPSAAPTTRAAAAELAEDLFQIIGSKFEVRTGDGSRGMMVGTLAEFPQAPCHAALEKAGAESKEAYALQSEPERLWLMGATDLGAPHAVFAFLDQLGCRWFMPSEKWTIFPHVPDLSCHVDTVVRPAFRMRNFFGTGGFGPPNPVDPKMTMRDRWDAWKRHNRFGGEFQFGGHAGEAFSLAARKELEAHPEYRAMVNGQRLPWALGVKPCVSNPEVVKLYVDFRLAALRQSIQKDPNSPASWAVSVEPADGGNHCDCPECRKLGSISDRVFYLANQVAKAVQKEFPGHVVSLYAYNEHAAPPSLPIEPNVYVTVIPYGFQRTGMTGDELITAWSQKIPRMSLYTYWSIPDWENCQPSFDFLESAPERIRYWHSHGVEGMSNESTFSGGAMGVAWYLVSRLLWDPQTDVKAMLADFYEKSFGPAAEPMQRMLERWSSNYMLSSHELALSFRDLQEARQRASGHSAVQARVDDFASYVQYLRLWYEYQEAKPASPERTATARRLMTFMWSTYDNAMVQTFRMYQLLALRYEKDKELAADFDPTKPEAAGWKEVKPVGRRQLYQLMKDGAATYQPLHVTFTKFEGPLEPLAKPTPNGKFSAPLRVGSTAEFEFEATPGLNDLPLKIKVTNRPNANPDHLKVQDSDGKNVFELAVPADGEIREIHVPLPHPGRYHLSVFDQKTMFEIQAPAGVPLVTRGFTSPDLSTRLYFYVPPGVQKLAMYAPGAIPIKLFDGDGKPVTYTPGKIFEVDVPTGQDGKAWSFQGYKSYTPLKLLNAPQAFAFFPDTLLAPKPQ